MAEPFWWAKMLVPGVQGTAPASKQQNCRGPPCGLKLHFTVTFLSLSCSMAFVGGHKPFSRGRNQLFHGDEIPQEDRAQAAHPFAAGRRRRTMAFAHHPEGCGLPRGNNT